MKKTIFLFFAAILCAMSVSANMVYLKPGNWLDAGADVWVHSWGGTQGDVAGVLKPVGLGLYGLDIKDNTKCKFVRQSGGQSGINWDNNWYKTDDLTITSGKECYHVSGWDVKGWIAVPSAYIAGAKELTGSNWSANAAANKMTKQNDGTWTLTKTISSINQGDYEYKVTDGSWDWSLGEGSNNKTINIPATGKYEVTFTYTPSPEKVSATATPIYSVTVNAGEGGNATGTGECKNGASITIKATASENYEFVNWTITSGTGTFAKNDEASTTFTPTSNATIQANFRSTLTYSLTVQGGTGIESVTGDNNNVTLGESYAITATLTDGYKFVGWTADIAANAEIANASAASTSVVVKNGSVVLTASAEEILSPLTTANSYDVGTPDADAPTFSTNQIGVATTATVKAQTISGYTLVGWTLTNCERTDGGADNATEITVKSTGTDAGATVTANYEINKYYVVGSFNGWNTKDANYEMIYDNGVYKKEVTFAKDVQFKICNGSWDANWGYGNLHGVEYKELEKSDDKDKNIKVTAEGTTTFTIVFNLAKNLITFENLTNKYSYVLMGVDGDWDNGIELSLNPDSDNEYVLKNQIIRSASDAVKVVTLDEGGNRIYESNTVKVGSVAYTLTTDGYENIVLADGVYNFWYNIWDGIYIEKSAAEDITLTGVTKTIFNLGLRQYTSLNLGDNSIQILNGADAFGYGTYDVRANLADDDINVAGFGTWEVVEGVETLTATLVDDEKTKVYNLTATVAAVETYTLNCPNAHYYKPSMMETAFVGEVDGETLTVTIESMEVGENYSVLGIYGETAFLAETATVSMSDLTTYALEGEFKDETGNIYNVSMTATPLPKTPVVVENATYTEVDGDIIITGDWSGTELTVTLYGYATSDNVLYKEAEMETDDIWAASTEVTLNKTADAFTITGEFIHGWEAAIYNVTISGALPTETPEVYTRTVTVGNFGTICLPFGSNNYTGAEFYELVGQETGKVYIGSVTTLEAGVPYIFRATGTELAVYSDGTTAATPSNNNGLHGTFTDNTEVAVGNYILYNNAICECNATCWVNANRAYIVWNEIPEGAPQKMPGRKYIGMGVQGENEETAIEDILSAEAPAKVIENGQLIIIRNGVKYNVQGQIVE